MAPEVWLVPCKKLLADITRLISSVEIPFGGTANSDSIRLLALGEPPFGTTESVILASPEVTFVITIFLTIAEVAAGTVYSTPPPVGGVFDG